MLQQLILTAAVSCLEVIHHPVEDVIYKPATGIASPTINPINTPTIDRLVIPITIDPIRGREAGGKPLRGKTLLGTAHETPDSLIVALSGIAGQISNSCAPETQRPLTPPKALNKVHKPLRH